MIDIKTVDVLHQFCGIENIGFLQFFTAIKKSVIGFPPCFNGRAELFPQIIFRLSFRECLINFPALLVICPCHFYFLELSVPYFF